VDHEATASLRAKGRVERPPAVPESFKNASVEGLEELHDSG
jgi:hypothetical protein